MYCTVMYRGLDGVGGGGGGLSGSLIVAVYLILYMLAPLTR